MAIHGVLVEGDDQVELVAGRQDRSVARSQGEKDVPATNDRLIGVVGVEVQATADEDTRQDVTWRSDTLTRCAADADCQIHAERPISITGIYTCIGAIYNRNTILGLAAKNQYADVNLRRRFGVAAVNKFFWQSSPAGVSPGLLALDLACATPQATHPRRFCRTW